MSLESINFKSLNMLINDDKFFFPLLDECFRSTGFAFDDVINCHTCSSVACKCLQIGSDRIHQGQVKHLRI